MSSVTPIPEPDIYALLLAGLGLVTSVARRRSTA
ncbi:MULTISPECIES: PEP-CTERM sorting domain-containing protein [Nitrosospira]|nr:PEP-CTERM sorting domain-containing protein [Nitrosospira sp. Nsp5]